jgi:hypothetical protein
MESNLFASYKGKLRLGEARWGGKRALVTRVSTDLNLRRGCGQMLSLCEPQFTVCTMGASDLNFNQ